MTIRLLRFPLLIVFKILESMPSNDKVLISFCSSKMRRLIRMVKWHVSKVLYMSYYEDTHIFLGYPTFDYGGIFVIEDVDEFTKKSKIFKEKTLGLQYGFSADIIEGKTATIVEILKSSQHFSRLAFHNIIVDLFRNPPVIEYDVGSEFNLSNTYIYEVMKNLRLSGNFANADHVEEYFSKAMDLHCAVVAPYIEPRLNKHSKLTTAKYLYFKNAYYQTRSLPSYFNGQRAVFKRSIYDQSVIMEIMKKWKSNEGFQHLQALEIYSLSNQDILVDVDEIRRKFDARPFDGLRRPENFEEEYRVLGLTFKPIKCADFLDIVRESDGKVASFLVTETMFKFCVWN